MIIIQNKVVVEKDDLGNDVDVNYPVEPFPENALRIHFDGTNWNIAEDKAEEDIIVDSCVSLKEMVESQKDKGSKSDPADPAITP